MTLLCPDILHMSDVWKCHSVLAQNHAVTERYRDMSSVRRVSLCANSSTKDAQSGRGLESLLCQTRCSGGGEGHPF